MMIIMRTDATPTQIDQVVAKVEQHGLKAHLSKGEERTIIGVVGDGRPYSLQDQFAYMTGVDRILPISRPYKLASREFIPENSKFPLDGTVIGGKGVVIIAGPCSVESRSQLRETALAVREAGAHALRGGAFIPRLAVCLQGLGEDGLELLAEVRQVVGLPTVTEAMSLEQVPLVVKYADVIRLEPGMCRITPLTRRSQPTSCAA
jgi:3-deoxy-7-phosphoheptulonate synthase